MKEVITRFAPSPTGKLHIGNARTAIINWLFARKHGGKFLLRMDDTDLQRSKEEYKEAIIRDLNWLGLNWEVYFLQSERLKEYEKAKDQLIKSGYLYECYETQEELEIKRKFQLAKGKPPVYDRSSLTLTEEKKHKFKLEGRKPHYRFKLDGEATDWDDLIKGPISVQTSSLSDPIFIREDGTMTYMLCSTVDDIDYNISHIIRGEDHVTNTAIQMQLFKALGKKSPVFGHLALIKNKDGKISKRIGGFELESLRKETIEPITIISFLATIGRSKAVDVFSDIHQVIEDFDISSFTQSSASYQYDELLKLNHKIVSNMDFSHVKSALEALGLHGVTEEFWLTIRNNINSLNDTKRWWQVCSQNFNFESLEEDSEVYLKREKEFFNIALQQLPDEIDESTWASWTGSIKKITGRKGKDLYIPLRLVLTGVDHGPELKPLLPLIGKENIVSRLKQWA